MGKPSQLKDTKIEASGKIPARGNAGGEQGPIHAPGLSDSKSYSKMKGAAGSASSQKGVK